MFAAFVLDYSGGTAPDFNGIPYLTLSGTQAIRYLDYYKAQGKSREKKPGFKK